jgi:aspartyl-tRNA(Asn)/glutamyl-tRNA(Gln) amidotransferase subunit A
MPTASDWPWRSLADVGREIRRGGVSPVELTRACLDRIERVNPAVQAFVSIDAAGALRAAEAAEREVRAGGYRGPLHGVPREHFWERIEDGIEPLVRQALSELERAGARIEEVSIPHVAGALGAILVTEMASVTAWHDRYLKQPERRARYTPEVRFLMDAGKFVFATDFLKAQRLRRVLMDEVRAAFAGVDALATPSLPLRAWEVSESHVQIGGQPEHVLHACWRFTYPWNLTGLPALSVPCGFAGGLPVGLQLVGRPFDEAMILRVGHAYQEATNWHERRPPDPAPAAR